MNDELNTFSTEVDGQRYLKPELATQENDAFIQNLRGVQAQQNLENRQTLDNLGSYPSSQSNLGGLGGGEATFINNYQTTPTNNIVATLRAAAEAQALTQAMQNEVNYLQNKYKRTYQAKAKAAKANGGNNSDDNTTTWDGEVGEEVVSPENFYGVPGAVVSETDTHYIYTDPKTGEQTKVSKDYMNTIYDKDGNITDDGAVILDTRRLLNM